MASTDPEFEQKEADIIGLYSKATALNGGGLFFGVRTKEKCHPQRWTG